MIDIWKRNSEKRARELLKSWVTPEQLDQFDREGKITLFGQSGTVYVINRWFIETLEGETFCFQPASGLLLPSADNALARMIMLQCAEEEALVVANYL